MRTFKRKRLKQVISSFITNRVVSQFVREESALSNRLSLSLVFIFIAVFSLFVYQCFSHYLHGIFIKEYSLLLYLKICVFIIIVYAVKVVIIRLLGFIFKMENMAWEYIFNILLFNKTLGLFLFPVTLLMTFFIQIPAQYFIFIGLSIIIVMYLLRTLRMLTVGLRSIGFSKFYLFLYLCALELLPLIILFKVFVVRFSSL